MRLRRLAVSLGVLALAALAVPGIAAAGGASISSSCSPEGRYCYVSFSYTAAAGEANALTFGGGTYADANAPVFAGEGCVQEGPNRARCVPPGPGITISSTIDVKDGNDSVVAPTATVSGGPGNDSIKGATVIGGLGDDRIEAPSADYGDKTSPVSVDLRTGVGGTAGERDALVGVQSVTGGGAADTITGDDLANTLDGGGGDDRVQGLAGNDVLGGGGGSDTIECGRGKDLVGDDNVSVDSRDLLARDCERVSLFAGDAAFVKPRITRKTFSLRADRVACPCRGRLKVTTTRGTLLASGRTRDRRGRVTLPLTSSGQRVLRRRGALRVVVRWKDSGGSFSAYSTVIRR